MAYQNPPVKIPPTTADQTETIPNADRGYSRMTANQLDFVIQLNWRASLPHAAASWLTSFARDATNAIAAPAIAAPAIAAPAIVILGRISAGGI